MIKVSLQKLSWHHIDFMIVSFIAKISLDLDQFDYSGLTVDYGEYFNLSVDFYFDHDRRSKYRMCWSANCLHHAVVCI